MDEANHQAVERSIRLMQDNLNECLTVNDLARSAMFSKFHFSRTFRRATGVSPCRFLSAMRLAEARRLLLATGSPVADICHEVGYNSVGTFSARFSNSVGCSPSAFRQTGGRTHLFLEPVDRRLPIVSTVRGQLSFSSTVDHGSVFVGLFPSSIVEGLPAAHAFLTDPGSFTLRAPQGTWFVVACALSQDTARETWVGHSGPVTVRRGLATLVPDIELRPRRRFDPPVLLALPVLHGPPRVPVAA